MKVSVTTAGSLMAGSVSRGRTGIAHTISAGIRGRLQIELDRELDEVLQSERALVDTSDPESRRDALERAVRRVWGVPQ
jgi:hypothetical protein